ncbi:MAG: hypothetical protein WC554_07935 [Clostridia bacterium]
MMSAKMSFVAHKSTDGNIHVQNYVGAMSGQHHVHSPEGFEKWKRTIHLKDLTMEDEHECFCGLKPGDVREYDGWVWKNEMFQ